MKKNKVNWVENSHFEAEEKKDLLPDKVLTHWIFSKLLDKERLPDFGTEKVVHKDMTVVDSEEICR